MSKNTGRPKLAGLGFHKNLGQYRKVVNGRSIYFGSHPEQALARYQLFLETGLIWKRGYRQFCLERGGKVIPLGATAEVARRNFAAHQGQSAATKSSVRPTEFVVNTVREVGDAYIHWLRTNAKSSQHIAQTKQHFQELLALEGCGDVQLENLTVSYFKNWYYHCRDKVTQGGMRHNWSNRRMANVKAAFLRCQKEGWLGVAMTDLGSLLAVLQTHSGPQLEQAIFKPAELRTVLRAACLQDRAAILLGLNCAIGNTDIGRLRWGDLTTRVFGGQTEWIFEQARGKTGRRRRTPLWPLTVQTLEKWRSNCTKRGVSSGPENLLFTTRDGTPLANAGTDEDGGTWRHDAVSAHLAKLLTQLGMKRPRLNWYSLRHTAATWATDYATDGSLVGEGNQFLLGQAGDVMWKTYSKGVPPSIRRAVDAIWRGLNDGEALMFDDADG